MKLDLRSWLAVFYLISLKGFWKPYLISPLLTNDTNWTPERNLMKIFLLCRGFWSASGGDRAVWAALRGAFGSSGGGAVCNLHQGAWPEWGGLVSPVRTGQSGQGAAGGFWCRGEALLWQVQWAKMVFVCRCEWLIEHFTVFDREGFVNKVVLRCVLHAVAQMSTRWRHCWSSTSDCCQSHLFLTSVTRTS